LSKVAPALCSSFKGVLPSDLLEKYTVKGGMRRFEYDLAILNEIHDQVKEAQGDSNKDGATMESRKRQRRQARQELTDDGAVELLKQGGFLP
jgi:hypothetical protein|tara:strand:+ start:720 stop:995 length:276 start_codon:yes stop_codon:yes gene_type:complete